MLIGRPSRDYRARRSLKDADRGEYLGSRQPPEVEQYLAKITRHTLIFFKSPYAFSRTKLLKLIQGIIVSVRCLPCL
ncbi:Uncharacterized protein HZ326_2276 [Fusarium oxysporum f. sp. albedinis]|nr:Uncharacterized protein HZ326_2276 [Fusarium oxysporum f. sp. albedinis]